MSAFVRSTAERARRFASGLGPLRTGLSAGFTGLSAGFILLLMAPAAGADARNLPGSFADLAAKVTPSVVNISSLRQGDGASAREQPFTLPEDSPFSEMFRRFRQQRQQQERHPATRALGSGFVIDSAGYIATNNHVIEKSTEITVTLQDGRRFRAKLVGTDPLTDLALLKIDNAGTLPALKFGDSSKVRVGDWVMAVGNPFNLGGTVTVGVLSARNRNLSSGPYDLYLQIDAPINKGNSGGPLFDLAGDVIGINSAIYSTGGGNIGIGFAIPSSIASKVLAELKEHGKVERGRLGVYIQPMTDDLAKAMGLDKPRGALVSQVQDGSPAEKAGLKAGDVVLAVDGRRIEQSRDLVRFIADTHPGKSVQLTIWRDKHERKVEVTLAALKSAGTGTSPAPKPEKSAGPSFGLALGPLTERARLAYGIPRSVDGVLIGGVAAGGAAEQRGLEAGDVIVTIGGKPVASVSDAADKLKGAKKTNTPVVLMVSRRGKTHFVVLTARHT